MKVDCVELAPDIERRLRELTAVFLEENKKLNLSAFRTEENCWIGNVLDSIAAMDLMKRSTSNDQTSKRINPSTTLRAGKSSNDRMNILDIGTGGGFPLLALALLFPDHHFTGLDSIQKKIDAIGRITGKMQMTNVTVIAGRAEELGHDPDHRERYDVVTARAVAALPTLIELAAPFAKVGGQLLFWKSLAIEQELKDSLLARAELSSQLKDQHRYTLPGDWGKRQILIFEKRFKTQEKYPRDVGIPGKNPIL